MTTRFQRRLRTTLRVAATLPAILVIAACASAPPAPEVALQAAQQAISSAERSDAGRHAPGELTQARDKLATANVEVAAKRMVTAERYAEESRASAELASAKAGVMKANATNEEMRRSTTTLVEEMQRNSNTGVTP